MNKKHAAAAVLFFLLYSAAPVYAQEHAGGDGWKVVFDGKKMESNFAASDIADSVYALQPGDHAKVTVRLVNTGNKKADWYMSNEILTSLEDGQSEARGGAYVYCLSYMDDAGNAKTLYSSENVGGEKENPAGLGLHEATESLEDFFYLDRQEAGFGGSVILEVALEGETQGNAYQDALAGLQMRFAAETVRTAPSRPRHIARIHRHRPAETLPVPAAAPSEDAVYFPNDVKTGDGYGLLGWSVAALAGGMFLSGLFFAGRRRKKGGDVHA